MKRLGSRLQLSATDLATHVGCSHLTALKLRVLDGALAAPPPRQDAILAELGIEHERRYVAHLQEQQLSVVEPESVEATIAALRAGVDVIYQGHLSEPAGERFFLGRPDILRRVARPSALGDWSYEVYDTKLSINPRAGAIIQLCVYSDLLTAVQGLVPEWLYLVPPRPDFAADRFRVADFQAYVRQIRRDFEAALASNPSTYPEPVEHCAVCPWWKQCQDRRREDDHLSLVANMSRLQRREAVHAGHPTLAVFAQAPTLVRPRRGSLASLQRAQRQALVQLRGRQHQQPEHELLPAEPGRGLGLLPTPSPGDVFLDLEGDPLVPGGGREYLFGLATIGDDGQPVYTPFWALTAEEEAQAFAQAIDFLIERWQQYPDMHVYHFAPYEPAAFKRLMGRTGLRVDEMDRLLRGERFVDLLAVVRQGVRCSVESYSIKRLEPFYGFTRQVALEDASAALRLLSYALVLGQPDTITSSIRSEVEGYNRDDCVSALRLRDWLEQLRPSELPRPVPLDGEPSEALTARLAQRREVEQQLVAHVPATPSERTPTQQARWLLAQLLEWHRREDRVKFWERYRLRELGPEDLLDEPAALGGLVHVARTEPTGKERTVVDDYTYPEQEGVLKPKDAVFSIDDGSRLGTLEAIDRDARRVSIRKTQQSKDDHPSGCFTWKHFDNDEAEDALLRIGTEAAAHGFPEHGLHAAAGQLLERARPRLLHDAPLQLDGERASEAAVRVVNLLDDSVLAIQGPPGTGKTHTAALMILAALAAGKRVGVTATSHEVIRNLLQKTRSLASTPGQVQSFHKESETSLDDARAALDSGQFNVFGGTVFLWARQEFAGRLDLLFVDEAGQMSLANVVAASHAAKSLVLLGDPQQLEQPQQGSHPDGAGVSALEHLFAGVQTIPAGAGLFLDETYRMAPAICRFTSELFYEDRLRPRPLLEQQRLDGTARFSGAGYFYVPVAHEGNRNASTEEADAIIGIVAELLQPNVRWTDSAGVPRPLGESDILVIAPYNLQVAELTTRLNRPGIRIGTVDKFQGKEAPVVIYSMATSAPEDAPRGMEFLYSLNRLNVATSRAKSTCLLVASPRLFEPECKTPEQMRLANALCRYRELATLVG